MKDSTRMKQAKQREEYPATNMPPQKKIKIQFEQDTGYTENKDPTMHVRTEQSKIKSLMPLKINAKRHH